MPCSRGPSSPSLTVERPSPTLGRKVWTRLLAEGSKHPGGEGVGVCLEILGGSYGLPMTRA
jgi:hypothetical protein